jgi:hypothetical protein
LFFCAGDQRCFEPNTALIHTQGVFHVADRSRFRWLWRWSDTNIVCVVLISGDHADVVFSLARSAGIVLIIKNVFSMALILQALFSYASD